MKPLTITGLKRYFLKSVRAQLITAAATLLAVSPASAASITFVFDHYTVPPHVAPHTPIPGGPFGTLTFTDSAVDPNRVDIDLTITPPPAYAAATLEQLYINFATPFLTNHDFYLVMQNAPVGVASNNPYGGQFPGDPAGFQLGSVGYSNGVSTFDLADFVFDVNPNPTSGNQTFAGSLSLYNKLPAVDTPVNLDVAMFNVLSGGTNMPPMYAAYRTNVFNVNPNDPNFPDGEFWSFANAPEPSALALFSIGIIALLGRRPNSKSLPRIAGLVAMAFSTWSLAAPAQAAFVVSAPTLFTDLDGSVNDDDGLIDGVFTRLGDGLQLTNGGSITFNDLGAAGNSAGNMAFNIFGDVELFSTSGIFAQNLNGSGSGGDIRFDVGGNFLMQADTTISAAKTTGTGGGIGGRITIDVAGNVDLQAGSLVSVNSVTSAGAIRIRGHEVSINGEVLSQGDISGVGANQPPGGGPITIIAHCDLTVGDNGVVSSSGRDPGADLVHLEACDVTIYGLVESTGAGHAIPNNPANHLNSTNRPDKSPNSTGGVEIWAGNKLTIDNTGTHNGEINADLTLGAMGRSWIDLISGQDIELISDGTGAFLVHGTNGGNNPTGATIQLIAVGGDITSSGLAINASAGGSGFPDGGHISLQAFNDILLGNSTLLATGDFNPNGGLGNGGQIDARAFNGALTWLSGIGDVRPVTGGAPGTIDLTYATLIDLLGTAFNNGEGGLPTQTNLIGGSPTLQSYVQLPDDCENCIIPEPGAATLAIFAVALGLRPLRLARRNRAG